MKKRIIFIIAAACLAASGFLFTSCMNTDTGKQQAPVTVMETAAAEPAPLSDSAETDAAFVITPDEDEVTVPVSTDSDEMNALPDTHQKESAVKDTVSKPAAEDEPEASAERIGTGAGDDQKSSESEKVIKQSAPKDSISSDGKETKTSKHKHVWVETVIHHNAVPEEGHYEKKLVKEAWDEPVYEQRTVTICNGCGADLTGKDINAHEEHHALNDEPGGWRTDVRMVETGHICHEAEYEEVYVVDTPGKAAWDDHTGKYCCEVCGKEK